MLINDFDNRLFFELGDAVGYDVLRGHVGWVVVQGTDGKAIGSGETRVLMSGLVGQTVVPKTVDSVAKAADPKRMKKITNMMLYNDDSASHRVYIYLDTGGALSKAWTCVIPAQGSLIYDGGQFQVYRSDGSKIESTVAVIT